MAEWSERGLCALHFPETFKKQTRSFAFAQDDRLQEDLHKYLEGHSVSWRTPLDFGAATAFQRSVWQAIAKIPFGEVRSYAWLAETAGQSSATRAVANACGANPFPIIIPCHRVVVSNGSLGGYSAGVAWKEKLLFIERESHHHNYESLKMDNHMPGIWAGSLR